LFGALFYWREELAKNLDVNQFKLFSNVQLGFICRSKPKCLSNLESICPCYNVLPIESVTELFNIVSKYDVALHNFTISNYAFPREYYESDESFVDIRVEVNVEKPSVNPARRAKNLKTLNRRKNIRQRIKLISDTRLRQGLPKIPYIRNFGPAERSRSQQRQQEFLLKKYC